MRAADGSYRWFLIRGEPLVDKDGKILKWFGTCTDIQEIKDKEADLQKNNEIMLGREVRMYELKEEIERLKKQK